MITNTCICIFFSSGSYLIVYWWWWWNSVVILAGKYNRFCWLTVKPMWNAYVNCFPNISLLHVLGSFLRECLFGSCLHKYIIGFGEEAVLATVIQIKLCRLQLRENCVFLFHASWVTENYWWECLHIESTSSKHVCQVGCVFSRWLVHSDLWFPSLCIMKLHISLHSTCHFSIFHFCLRFCVLLFSVHPLLEASLSTDQ